MIRPNQAITSRQIAIALLFTILPVSLQAEPNRCDQIADESCDAFLRGESIDQRHDPCFDALRLPRFSVLDELEGKGILFEGNLTTFYQGNVAGGAQKKFQFAGHGDYAANLNLEKLGLGRGQFLQIRAEHRFGDPITQASGSLLPPSIAPETPVRNSDELFITNFLFIQALSENFALYFGKVDSLGEMSGSLTSGRGLDQFSNLTLVSNPIGMRSIAFSTLGAGFSVMHGGEKVFNFLALNAHDTVETTGLSELYAKGVALIPELTLPTRFGGKRGKHSFMGIWSTREFAELAQSPLFLFPTVPIQKREGTWVLSYEAEQYLANSDSSDRVGWGIFGRAAIADQRTNPIRYLFTLGIAGNNLAEGRENDRFGIGYFYYGISHDLRPAFTNLLGGLRNGQGVELFYNFALNDQTALTFDTQILRSPLKKYDTAFLIGTRLNFAF